VDNSSGISAGRIPWSDIKGFGVSTIQKQRILTDRGPRPEQVRGARVLLDADRSSAGTRSTTGAPCRSRPTP
jgi:hypothetical protein